MNAPMLFPEAETPQRARKVAHARVEVAVSHAADKAERVDPGWKETAIEQVRQFALEHETFILEDVHLSIPADADPRAAGAIASACRARRIVRREGTRTDRWGSHKTVWRSLIWMGGAA